ncbi:MAG: DUF2911 domain-containing protein [Bacteroidota bacterium]
MKNNCIAIFKVFVFALCFGIVFNACGPTSPETETETETEVTTEEPTEAEEIPSPPRTATGTIGETSLTIDYSSPGVKGRTIYGDLVPYDKVWRTGANAATILTVSGDIKIEGEALPQGKYSFFSIPSEEGSWTFILNKTWDQWGAYDYEEKEDALRVLIEPIPMEESVERLRFEVDEDAGKIVFVWDDVMCALNIEAG